MRLALAIIARDEVQKVKDIADKYSSYFDGVYVAYDSDVFDNEDLGEVKKFKYDWSDEEKAMGYPNFDQKRNFLADKIDAEYYFRLDTDDEIKNAAEIRAVFRRIVEHKVDIYYVPYHYAKDTDGNNISLHWRETIIRKKKGIYWNKNIHENILIEDMSSFNGVKDDTIAIIHNKDISSIEATKLRNFKFLLREFDRDKENTDPRTIAYLGRVICAEGQYEKAIPFLKLLVSKSGWDDDKYFAYVQLAECYHKLGHPQIALAACNEALEINTRFPDAYIKKAEICLDNGHPDKALDWISIAYTKPVPDTLIVYDPTLYGYKLDLLTSLVHFHRGDFKKAWEYFSLAKHKSPSSAVVTKYEDLFKSALENDEAVKNITWLAMFLKDKAPDKVSKIIDIIPDSLLQDERMFGLKNRFAPAREWGEKSVVIFTGRSWEDWAAPSIHKGIGGSEEAVIYLSRELKKLGYDVTVFSSCGDFKGKYDGVEYKEFFEFNPNDHFNIVISWRGNIFGGVKNVKKRIIWLHDIPIPGVIKEDEVNTFDKVVVLSQYHRNLLPAFVPEEKIYVSRNGINLDDFSATQSPREPHRIIYTSSYDRGLEHLLDMWSDIRKSVPSAELHVFYGWDTYDKMVNEGRRSPAFKQKMLPKMNQAGVFDHGRVGHKNLAKELMKSQVFAYPSHFEEISCISLMKAQAAGCIPIVTSYGALSETCKCGYIIEGKAGDGDTNERFKKKLIDVLLAKENDISSEKVIQNKAFFGWDKVAQEWARDIFV